MFFNAALSIALCASPFALTTLPSRSANELSSSSTNPFHPHSDETGCRDKAGVRDHFDLSDLELGACA
jgi:hypothetical protein